MSDFRLKVFYSVAKNQSFTRAAKELFVSQPAITKHINELERQFSVRLFDRTGGKIVLTDAGRLLLEHCSRILDEYNRMEYDMSLLNARSCGHISIGASTTIAQYVLPQILAEFTERFPQIKVSLTNGNSREIENALVNHDIDLGMVEGVTHSAGLQYEPFLEDELVMIVKTAGNESLPEETTPQELCRLPLVIREQGSGTLEVIENELARHGIKPSELNIRIRLGSTEAIKAFLRNSRSVGIVSVFSVRDELARGVFRVIDISGLNFSRHFCFVASAGKDSPLAEKFKDFTRRSIITSGYRV